jgi:nucleoside-diphosphate-sugar epimerase
MKILFTSASDRLTQRLADALSVEHDVTLTDLAVVDTPHRFVQSDLGHDPSTNELIRGVDVIVHSGAVDPNASVSDQIDYQTRATYALMWAAWEEKVPRIVYLSSLELVDAYGPDYLLTEEWKPRPTPEPPSLTYHLGEFVCKQFAREHKLKVVSLRFGDVLWDESEQVGPTSLYLDDAVQAVDRALSVKIRNWEVYHVQSSVPDQRYLTRKAYNPEREAPGSPSPRTWGLAMTERGEA